MKLLVITQKVNQNDSNLGFFHEWLKRLAQQIEHLYIICLEKGEYTLPSNVTVLSLGKEEKASRWQYIIRFFSYIFKYRHEYDGVFIHMNPEYAVLGGLLWKLWHKKVLLWYTHKSVDFKLWLAEKFVDKIFTASKESFRLPSKKVEVVGHGIPVELFSNMPEQITDSKELWLLTVGRVSPSKDQKTIIKAVDILRNTMRVLPVRCSIYGSTITVEDKKYQEELKKLAYPIVFTDKNPLIGFRTDQHLIYSAMPSIYHRYQIFLHTSRTGSMDKVVLEALAAGRIVVTSSEAYASLAGGELKGVVFSFPPGDYQELARKIEEIWKNGVLESIPNQRAMEYVRQHHNLNNIVQKIISYFAQN